MRTLAIITLVALFFFAPVLFWLVLAGCGVAFILR